MYNCMCTSTDYFYSVPSDNKVYSFHVKIYYNVFSWCFNKHFNVMGTLK